MKEIKPGYYSIMPEMVAQQKTINLHSDGLGIRFMIPFPTSLLWLCLNRYGVSIKMEESDLTMQLGFKQNEILLGPTSIASPFMANIK